VLDISPAFMDNLSHPARFSGQIYQLFANS